MSSSISIVSELPKPPIDGLLYKLLEAGMRLIAVGNSAIDCIRLAFTTSSCKKKLTLLVTHDYRIVESYRKLTAGLAELGASLTLSFLSYKM